ncbi:MAG: polysaccharide pyruvyl transferase family protein [Phycisphaerae bacterium]
MTERKLNVAVLTGYWSTNVGNAFFQLGAQWALQQVLPKANVFLIGDEPGYWCVRRGNPDNALDYAAHLDIDAIALLGPFVRPEAPKIVGNLLRSVREKGIKLIILAAGMMQYDKATIQLARDLLADIRPVVFTSRDTETYESIGDLAENAYDGIDVATFVSDLFQPVPTDLPDYVTLNFDQIPEPTFVRGSAKGTAFEWEDETWAAVHPRLRTELSYKSRAFPFLEAFLPRRQGPTKLGPYAIVRTDHRYNPFLPRRSYHDPNTYVGDIPHSYLNIYANTACTFSNRVHACVATTAYGNPAMLFTRSPRAYLLKRLGLNTIKDKPTSMDMDFLREEKQGMLAWLREKLAPLRN